MNGLRFTVCSLLLVSAMGDLFFARESIGHRATGDIVMLILDCVLKLTALTLIYL